MPLRGKGVLAIWNGIAGGADDEFLEWHLKEHIPERIGVPGFRRGRRYVAIDGTPPYFNFYEVDGPEVLTSAPYLQRLDDPTPWTRKVLATFVDTSRTICRVEHSAGLGSGTFLAVLPFQQIDAAAPAGERAALLDRLLERPGVVGAHALIAAEAAAPATAESRLRGRPDTSWGAILMVEAATLRAVEALGEGELGDASLARSGFAAPAQRGLYRLEFTLDRIDLQGPGGTGDAAGSEPAGRQQQAASR